jgi:hypothetical protein
MNFEVVISFCEFFVLLELPQKGMQKESLGFTKLSPEIELLAHNITPKNGSHSTLLL